MGKGQWIRLFCHLLVVESGFGVEQLRGSGWTLVLDENWSGFRNQAAGHKVTLLTLSMELLQPHAHLEDGFQLIDHLQKSFSCEKLQ